MLTLFQIGLVVEVSDTCVMSAKGNTNTEQNGTESGKTISEYTTAES